MSPRTLVGLGAVLAGLAVAAGGFGAHALHDRLSPHLLDAFETAARYQMYHALALILLGLAVERWPSRMLDAAGWLFLAAIVLFSGSLYVLALSGVRGLGAITPLGGVAFMGGWACMALGLASRRDGS